VPESSTLSSELRLLHRIHTHVFAELAEGGELDAGKTALRRVPEIPAENALRRSRGINRTMLKVPANEVWFRAK
jgi:hypothetical protein